MFFSQRLDRMRSSITFNGPPFRAGDFERELMRATCEAVKSEMYHRFAAIRHPETGEFPTVRVLGDELDDLRLSVEGSQVLLECVAARMSDDERKAATLMPMERVGPPRAFLSYSFEDRDLAERVARKLTASGVDAWWAEWEIRAGDSLRQKIDEGLERCSHFIVLLTPSALLKPWVQQEMDAGLVRRIAGEARFIALRAGLPACDLPPLLSGMLSPEIGEDFERSVRDLVNDIHEVTRKPALGPAPSAATLPKTDFSPTATAVAKSFVEGSPNGEFGDFQQDVGDLAASIGVSAEDIEDALYELRDHVSESFGNVMAKGELYAAFDGFFKEWKPDQDALRLATDLMNDPEMPTASAEIAERYGWSPRRFNAAATWLETRKVVRSYEVMGCSPWVTPWVEKTDATRRFVKSRA